MGEISFERFKRVDMTICSLMLNGPTIRTASAKSGEEKLKDAVMRSLHKWVFNYTYTPMPRTIKDTILIFLSAVVANCMLQLRIIQEAHVR